MNENLNEKTGENAGENAGENLPQTESHSGDTHAPDGRTYRMENQAGGTGTFSTDENAEEKIPYFKKLYETLKNEGERSTNAVREELLCSARHAGSCTGYTHCGGADCICHEVFPWVGFVGLTFASGWISSLFLQPSTFRWFATLTEPAMMPPQWIFLPVWILLYFLLGTSVWISWRKAGCRRALPVLVLYGILMLLQIAWCYTFFYGHNPFGGFINLIWIFGVSLLLMLASLPICRCAAALLLPQVLWIFYALVINYQIWHLNIGGVID